MRALALALSLTATAIPLPAQSQLRRMMPASGPAGAAEAAVKQAMEQLVAVRKICDRDVEVLAHLRNADKALADPMQPDNAMQKAYEELDAADRLESSVPPAAFVVSQGILAAKREVDSARRSPVSADFGHLRAVLRTQALVPASRTAVGNARRMEEELFAWLKVQRMIADLLQALSDATGDSLRASELE